MKIFLVFLLGILITFASFGLYQFYIIQNNTAVPVIKTDITIPVTNNPTTPVNIDTQKTNCVTEEIVGTSYTFCSPTDHNITKNVRLDDSKSFTFTSRATGDVIIIEEWLGSNAYTDSDSKFGDVKVAYSPQKKIWEATGECDSLAPCNRSFVTSQGVQVFIGRSRWLTYIVPLDNTGILVLNSTGGGFVKPLEELIQTVRIEKK